MRRATSSRRAASLREWFQFTPVMRRATPNNHFTHFPRLFQFTPVMRRATLVFVHDCHGPPVSIHARHATGDATSPKHCGVIDTFQFTPVMRRATDTRVSAYERRAFQFTPVMRRATWKVTASPFCGQGFNSRPSCDGRRADGEGEIKGLVSIHARHATGDITATRRRKPSAVSIHARHATGDRRRGSPESLSAFQFTPVMRRATTSAASGVKFECFNSRPSCDGRRERGILTRGISVSIHARHATGDTMRSRDALRP